MGHERTIKEIIDSLGGPSAVAREPEIQAPVSTVGTWSEKNFVPRWWRANLVRLAKRMKVPLTDADFPAKQRKAA